MTIFISGPDGCILMSMSQRGLNDIAAFQATLRLRFGRFGTGSMGCNIFLVFTNRAFEPMILLVLAEGSLVIMGCGSCRSAFITDSVAGMIVSMVG